MTIEQRKQQLIHWIDGLHDEKTVKRLETMQNMSDDWNENITETEKSLIDEGLVAIAHGKTHSHAEVMEEAAAYLKKVK